MAAAAGRRRLPQGRAARVWLLRRIGVAERAADVLERKRRLLRREKRRLDLLTGRTESEWGRACEIAETWLLRASLVGGEDQVSVASRAAEGETAVTLRWESTVGVRYPSEAEVRTPRRPPQTTNVALLSAADAYRRAIEAGVRHAAASYASRLVDQELVSTAQRLRSIERRWIPGLHSDLAEVEQRIDELEREAAVCLRWAHAVVSEGRQG